jgi:hypothetical protein
VQVCELSSTPVLCSEPFSEISTHTHLTGKLLHRHTGILFMSRTVMLSSHCPHILGHVCTLSTHLSQWALVSAGMYCNCHIHLSGPISQHFWCPCLSRYIINPLTSVALTSAGMSSKYISGRHSTGVSSSHISVWFLPKSKNIINQFT